MALYLAKENSVKLSTKDDAPSREGPGLAMQEPATEAGRCGSGSVGEAADEASSADGDGSDAAAPAPVPERNQ